MSAEYETAYSADRSPVGKLRRRLARWRHRRPLRTSPARPLISISFDDAPLTATQLGATLLEEHGVLGTFYVSAGLAGKIQPMGICAGQDEYVSLSARGHEMACHTFSHLDCGRAAGGEVRADVQQNAEVFKTWGLPAPVSFAYPYGDVSATAKAALDPHFRSLRGLHPGLVERGSDLNQMPAIGIEGPYGEATVRRWMERAKDRRAWLILYTHDVQDAPSPWGCTPQALDRLITEAMAMDFEFVTVGAGIARLCGPNRLQG